MTNYIDLVLNGEDVEVPQELVEDEEIFKSVISYQTWQSLSLNDRTHLQKFLPSFSVNSQRSDDDTARLAFSDDRNFKHGNAIDILFRKMKAGCYSPRIARQLKKCRKLKYKDYKLKEKQRCRRLLQEILVSRQRILDQLTRHGPGQPIKTTRCEATNLPYSVDEKVRKKYQRIIKDVKNDCQDETISSDEEDDLQSYEHPSIPFYSHEHQSGYRYPVQTGFPGMFMHSAAGPRYDFSPNKSPASQALDISDKGYKDMLEGHRKRRICNEAHPELDVSTISLADIIMRANPTKKGSKKSKKVKKLKKCRDEKIKAKKKHRSALPPLTAQDVLRIKQESARQLNFEKEEIVSEEKIEEHFETSSVNDDEEEAKCFFTLLRGYFVERPDFVRSELELEESVATWESSEVTAHLGWTKEQTGWSSLISHALHFLAGRVNPLPDMAPLVSFIEETNEWKWIGMGHDDERVLVPLCNLWLDSLKDNQNEESDSSIREECQEPKEDETQSHNQPKTDFVVRPSTDHEKAVFQLQERKRYENPHKPYIYRMHGFTSTVGPVKGVFNKDTGSSKAREHALLVSNRPAYVTILSLVRDAVARLPNGEGTRAEVCQLLKDSLFINPEASDAQIHAVVSGALDRLHAEKDPCVKYDTTRKLWVYLHRVRSVLEFEKIHQASAAAAMAKKQLSQKQKSSSKKRTSQEFADVSDDVAKPKIKGLKHSGEKLKKSSKKLKQITVSLSNSEKPDCFDIAGSHSSSPMQPNFHTDFLLPKEEIGETSSQVENCLPYFASNQGPMPGSNLNQCFANSVPLKITLPRGAIGSFSPGSMALKGSKSCDQKSLMDTHERRVVTEETAISEHMIIDNDSSEFLHGMDSSFEDTF